MIIKIESSKIGSVKPIEFSKGNAIYEHTDVEYMISIKLFGITIYKSINKVKQEIEDKYGSKEGKVGKVGFA